MFIRLGTPSGLSTMSTVSPLAMCGMSCTGTVVEVQPFPEARKPAYKLWVDFGPEIGTRKSSAQVTVLYTPETLIGRQVAGVVNFPAKQVGPFMSEFQIGRAHV